MPAAARKHIPRDPLASATGGTSMVKRPKAAT